jgi:hypothetical protein
MRREELRGMEEDRAKGRAAGGFCRLEGLAVARSGGWRLKRLSESE